MSRENVEVVVEALRAFKATQRPTGLTTPDYVWDMSAFSGWPGRAQYHGPDEFMEFFAEWTEAYDGWDLDLEDARDAGGDRVVCAVRQRGRLRGADSWVELRFGVVYTVREGRLARTQVFDTPEEALQAVGLSE